jgi:hypothetical protein
VKGGPFGQNCRKAERKLSQLRCKVPTVLSTAFGELTVHGGTWSGWSSGFLVKSSRAWGRELPEP